MVSHCCFPAFAAGQMPVLRTVVVFVSIQLPSVGTGVIVCVVFVCLTLPTAEAGGFLFHRPVAFESVKGLQGLRKRLVWTCPALPLFCYVLCGRFELAEYPQPLVAQVVGRVDIPVVEHAALRACPFAHIEVLDLRVEVSAVVAELAGRIEPVHVDHLATVPSGLVVEHARELRPTPRR